MHACIESAGGSACSACVYACEHTYAYMHRMYGVETLRKSRTPHLSKEIGCPNLLKSFANSSMRLCFPYMYFPLTCARSLSHTHTHTQVCIIKRHNAICAFVSVSLWFRGYQVHTLPLSLFKYFIVLILSLSQWSTAFAICTRICVFVNCPYCKVRARGSHAIRLH